MQNITQSREISFGDFLEDIITKYLGLFYENLPKHVQYNNERMVFDQLFIYENLLEISRISSICTTSSFTI